MKRLIINLLALIALLTVGVMNFSAVTLAQDEPPALVDPFATGDDDDDDAPPALTLPPIEEPAAEEPPAEEPAAEEPPAEEAPPALTLPAADEEPPAEEAAPPPAPEHGAAAPASGSAYTGGTTAKSGPGLAIIGLGSLLGAAALRRKRK